MKKTVKKLYTKNKQKLTLNKKSKDLLANKKITSLERTFRGNRSDIVAALKSFHTTLGIEDNQKEVRDSLLQNNSYCVVTGQQLSWYGGPLYTFLKLMSAVLKARELTKSTGKTIIPVFWLADEDHDSALAIADEFFEWLDPEQLEDEETLYYDERELLELYAQRVSEQ